MVAGQYRFMKTYWQVVDADQPTVTAAVCLVEICNAISIMIGIDKWINESINVDHFSTKKDVISRELCSKV